MANRVLVLAALLSAAPAAFAAPAPNDPTAAVELADALRQKGAAVFATYPIFSQILRLAFPGGFVPASESTQGPYYLQESVPKGESVEEWSQMISVTGMRGAALNPNLNPDAVTEIHAHRYRAACPLSISSVDLGSGGLEAFEGHVTVLSCGTVSSAHGDHSEAMLLIVLKGREEYYTIQWATRGPAAATPKALIRDEWMARLQRLQPIRLCDKVAGEAPPYPSCIGKQ